MKKTLLLFVILFTNSLFSQAYKITYLKYSNGKIIENQDTVVTFASTKKTIISNTKITKGTASFPFEQLIFDPQKKQITNIGSLKKDKNIAMIDSISLGKQVFEELKEEKKILGYNCKKAKTIINSNHIEVWFTTDLPIKASATTLGLQLGTVLEINRNGNFVITASKIEKIKEIPTISSNYKLLNGLSYKDEIWKSRFATYPIFEQETINFSDKNVSNDSILKFANGTILVKKVKFSEVKKGSQIFMDLTTKSLGDAYDRTGSVFLIPTDKEISFLTGLQKGIKELPIYTNGNLQEYQGVVSTQNYNCLLELMRFFTPFGVDKYNHIELKNKKWHSEVPYRQDISEFWSVLSNKEVWIGVFIGNYDKGGHQVSVNITVHPDESKLNPYKTVLPLFNCNNVMEMAGQNYGTMFSTEKGLEVNFTLEKELKNAKLRYISTGHGGWENGDEFVPKKNTILWNQKNIYEFIPWRNDCGSYRLFNPASGNFGNGLSSSDYSRSNWCPGTITYPLYIDLGSLPAGNHTITVKIPMGEKEGTSFSGWNVSGVLLGE